VVDTGNNGSVNSGNGEAVFTYTRPVADIAVQLACPAHMRVGGTSRCRLTVTDNGPAAGTRLTAAISLSSSLSEVSCTPGCTKNGATYTWKRGSLATGASATFTLVMSAASTGPASVQGRARVPLPYRDPNHANNAATAVITVG
jgi:hypothetical protein